jgi:hypothetical protein
MPALEKDKRIGHFHFHWTETSADAKDNVSEAQVDETGDVLNHLWDLYSAELREPKADLVGGIRLLDVEIYFDAGLFGSTSSFRNQIFLNSRDVVRDPCRRQTTSAHELFHRVQYAYGYITGTPGQRWWVEALGSWSQQYAYPDEHDYVLRVESGLRNPHISLLTRSYDACHFWKHFGERLAAYGTFPSEREAVAAFLQEYNSNGRDAQAACDRVWSNYQASQPFNSLFALWATANFAKDFTGFPDGYADNARVVTRCGRNYGPYSVITPVNDIDIGADGQAWRSPRLFVNSFGTDYHRFRLDSSVTRVNVRFAAVAAGSGPFAVELLLVRGDDYRRVEKQLSTILHAWDLDVAHEDIDGFVAIVSALDGQGGEYIVAINHTEQEMAAFVSADSPVT